MKIEPGIVGAFFTGVVGPLVVVFIKEYLEKRKLHKKDPVAESLKTNILVDNKVNEILEEYGADRVWITQFHNGGHFYPTGRSIHKFSMFYENVAPGTTSIKDYFQNIPVSLFSKSVNQLLEEDVIEIADFKDETIATYGLKYVADEYGCKSGYLFAIKSIDNKFLGVLGIDYTKKRKSLTHDEISDIRVEVTSIGGVIMNHLQNHH